MIERGSGVPSSMPRRGRERAGGDVAHHDFAGDDLDFADQLLAHVDGADEVRRHADVVELREDEFRDAVVEDALAFDRRVLLVVDGGRIVLEMLDEGAGLGALIKDLGLALVNASATAHVMKSNRLPVTGRKC